METTTWSPSDSEAVEAVKSVAKTFLTHYSSDMWMWLGIKITTLSITKNRQVGRAVTRSPMEREV